MDLRSIIDKFAKEKKVIWGACSADRLSYLDDTDITAPFVHYIKEERINPKLTMPDAKSIIMIGVGNRKKEDFETKDFDQEPRGRLSNDAVGIDYHIIVKDTLEQLRKLLRQHIEFECKVFVDTGPLVEREFAKKAGLGWQGKSGNLVSDKFGTFFNIGYMMVDFQMKLDQTFQNNALQCGDCKACIDACPGSAISEKKFDYNKCVSYITQQKESLSLEQMHIMGENIYGCDICQNVCKHNIGIYSDKTIKDIEEIKPRLNEILKLTNKEFKDKYSKTAIGWRGNKILKRNALISGINQGGYEKLKTYDFKEHEIFECVFRYAQSKK